MALTFNLKPGEARKKWAEALRSGKYKQGRSRLCAQNADKTEVYCCLGVACEVFMEHEDGLEKRTSAERASSEYVDSIHARGLEMPFTVRDWLGMSSCEGVLINGRSLITVNDTLRMDFLRIADIVESDQLPKVNGFE